MSAEQSINETVDPAEVKRLHDRYLDIWNRYSQLRHDTERAREEAHNAYLAYHSALDSPTRWVDND